MSEKDQRQQKAREELLRKAFREAVHLLGTVAGSELMAKIQLNKALMKEKFVISKEQNYGWKDPYKKSIEHNKRLIAAITEIYDDVNNRCAFDLSHDEALDEYIEAREVFEVIDAPFDRLLSFYRDMVAGEKRALLNLKKDVRGQAPLHRRMDTLAEVWAEQGGRVSSTARNFTAFLSAGSRDLWQNENQLASATRSAIGRFNKRHNITARQGRRPVQRKAH